MDYIVYGWGMVFGLWVTFIVAGLVIFYFLYKNPKSEDKHLSA